MKNPMLQVLGQSRQQAPTQMSVPNVGQMIQQIRQFAQGVTPEQAKARVEQMVQSGQVQKEKLEQAMQMAQAISRFFGR